MSTYFESRFGQWVEQIKREISEKGKELDMLKKEHSARFRRNPFPNNPKAESLADAKLHDVLHVLDQSEEKENVTMDQILVTRNRVDSRCSSGKQKTPRSNQTGCRRLKKE